MTATGSDMVTEIGAGIGSTITGTLSDTTGIVGTSGRGPDSSFRNFFGSPSWFPTFHKTPKSQSLPQQQQQQQQQQQHLLLSTKFGDQSPVTSTTSSPQDGSVSSSFHPSRLFSGRPASASRGAVPAMSPSSQSTHSDSGNVRYIFDDIRRSPILRRDVDAVMKNTFVSEEQAVQALLASNNEVHDAILLLKAR